MCLADWCYKLTKIVVIICRYVQKHSCLSCLAQLEIIVARNCIILKEITPDWIVWCIMIAQQIIKWTISLHYDWIIATFLI